MKKKKLSIRVSRKELKSWQKFRKEKTESETFSSWVRTLIKKEIIKAGSQELKYYTAKDVQKLIR